MSPAWLEIAESLGLVPEQPPDGAAIAATRQTLGHDLSKSLRSLYAQTDGLRDEYGYALVLPVTELASENVFLRGQLYRDLYMPFDHVLAFGQQGNGDLFFHPVIAGAVREDVYVWDHEDDSRTWFARDVEDAVRRWMAGEAR